jgi:hypothetical protein
MTSGSKPERGPYRTFLRNLRRYFADYGGWRGLWLSPFLHFGVLVSALSYPTWMSSKWADVVTGIIPNLLGFSLGTYALLFSLMSNRMKQALKHLKNKAGTPYLDEINATFFHFILIQTISLSWAILMRSSVVYDLARYLAAPSCFMHIIEWGNTAAGFIGFTLLCYSLLLVIASSLAVYRLARIVDPAAT